MTDAETMEVSRRSFLVGLAATLAALKVAPKAIAYTPTIINPGDAMAADVSVLTSASPKSSGAISLYLSPGNENPILGIRPPTGILFPHKELATVRAILIPPGPFKIALRNDSNVKVERVYYKPLHLNFDPEGRSFRWSESYPPSWELIDPVNL